MPKIDTKNIDAEWAEGFRREVVDFATKLDEAYLTLAEMLYRVWDTPAPNFSDGRPLYKAWGYDTFPEYAAEELGLHKRKAYHLRRIYQVLYIDLKLEKSLIERFEALGYSKLRELVRVLDEDNVEEWLNEAEGLTYAELSPAITAYRTKQDENKEAAERGEETEDIEIENAPLDVKRFAFYPSQLEIVEEALHTASCTSNSNKDSHNLTLICLDYMATNGAVKPGTEEFRDYLSTLEQLLGVRLCAIDTGPTPHDLIYGAKAFDELIKSHEEEDAA